MAWLEELSGLELGRAEGEAQAAGAAGAHFARGEGLPRETLLRLDQSAVMVQMRPADRSVLVSQLDPDAPTRFKGFTLSSLSLRCRLLVMCVEYP